MKLYLSILIKRNNSAQSPKPSDLLENYKISLFKKTETFFIKLCLVTYMQLKQEELEVDVLSKSWVQALQIKKKKKLVKRRNPTKNYQCGSLTKINPDKTYKYLTLITY